MYVNMKKFSLFVFGIAGALTLSAQSYSDALRYSESFQEGNARFMSMGGAVSALGANVGAMSSNPAGSAVFKKSVIEFTPTYYYTKAKSSYLGTDGSAFVSELKIPSFGIVGYKPLKQNSVFVSGISYGFALNAQNRYNSTTAFAATNNQSSLSDDFLRLAKNEVWYDDYNTLAWDAYLVDTIPGVDDYFTPFSKNGVSSYGEYQDVEYQREGVKREFLFNFGVDFSEYVFFGVDLSFMNLYYNDYLYFTESDDNNTNPLLDTYTYRKNTEVTGNGVGGKFGMIVRPIEFIRIGGAFHTPISYNIEEKCDASLEAFYNQDVRPDTGYGYGTDAFESDYTINQPAKYVASLGFVYKNILNVGVDYEYMNYENCELRNVSTSKLNSQISEELTAVSNLKCGAEFRYGPFSFRGGYATYGNPYKSASGDFYRRDISGGVGLATNTFYYDLAVTNAKYDKNEWLYTDASDKAVVGSSTIHRTYVMFTAGFKF